MRKLVCLTILLCCPVIFSSCSSSGGSSDPANFVGTYGITAVFTDGNYSGIGWADIWVISQSGSNITAATSLGTLTGTIDGNSCTLSGSYLGGSMTCNLNLNGNVLTGTSRIETSLTWAEYDIRGVR